MLPNVQRPVVRVTDNDLLAAMQILACIARPPNPKEPLKQGKLEAGGNLLQAWFWSRKRHRGDKTPELDFLHAKSFQRSRIEDKLRTFSKDLYNAFEAGRWLQYKILGDASRLDPSLSGFRGISLRSLAADHWNRKNATRLAYDHGYTYSGLDDASNIRASIWTKRRPVVHMALAARNAIGSAALDREQPSEELKRLSAAWFALTPECERAYSEGEWDAPVFAEWNRLSKAISDERRNSRKPIELEAIVFDPVWVEPALKEAEEWAATIESRNLVGDVPLWRFVR